MPRRVLALAACLLLAVVGAGAQNNPADFSTIEDAATALNFTTLLEIASSVPAVADLLIASDIQGIVLAPTNEAFEKLNASLPGGLASLTPDQVAAVLQYHIIATNESFPYIDNTTRTVSETLLSGQVPPELVNANISFVPFEWENGTYVYAGGVAPGAVTDVEKSATAAQGRLYAIDTVLIPPNVDLGANYSLTIVGAAANNSLFTLLTGAVSSDPEVLALFSDPDAAYTVFAPTNDAFLAFLEAANLTLDDAQKLAGSPLINRVLKMHVLDYIPVLAQQLPEGTYTVPTLSTAEFPEDVVNITKTAEGSVSIQGPGNWYPVNVTLPDVQAGKSVIHVIDGLILPTISV